MRNPWQNGNNEDQRRGKSRRSSTGRSGSVPSNSPFDFNGSENDTVDAVDMLAIRADDELLDALASGRPVGTPMLRGHDTRSGGGFDDDQHILAMLQDWRSEIDSEPFPELMNTEQAAKAIESGQRGSRPRRRLMPVAAAAAAAVLAMSGVAVAASGAQPGDALWGISSMMNGQRAQSLEAEQRVQVALASAQNALAEGRVEDARTELSRVTPDLAKVRDTERRDKLLDRNVNLQVSAIDTHEGERVETDHDGRRHDDDPDRDYSGQHSGSPDEQRADEPGRGHELSSEERARREQLRRERTERVRAMILGQLGKPSDPSSPSQQPTTGRPSSGTTTPSQPSTRPSTEPTGGSSSPQQPGQPSQAQQPGSQQPTTQPGSQQPTTQPSSQKPTTQPGKPAPGQQPTAPPKPTPTTKPKPTSEPKPTPEPKPTAQPSKTESKPTGDKPSHTKPISSKSEKPQGQGQGRGESSGGRDQGQSGSDGRGQSGGGSRGDSGSGGGGSGGGRGGGHSEGGPDTTKPPQPGGTALDTPPGTHPGVGSSI